MDSLQVYYYRLYMESWHLIKTSDWFFWRQTFLAAIFSSVSFFRLFLFSPILIHQSTVLYFSSGEVDSQNRWRIIPGGYIIFQSHLILLQYLHIFSPHFFNWGDGSFSHSVICYISEGNISWLLLNPLYSKDNHMIIGYGFFYLNRCNIVACYPIDFFGVGSGRNLEGGSTCLSVHG